MSETTVPNLASDIRVSSKTVIIAAAAAGVMVGFLAEPLSILVSGGLAASLVVLLAAAAWPIDDHWPQVGSWLAVGDLVLLILLLQHALRAPELLALLAIPTALAAALRGLRAAASAASVQSLIVLGLAAHAGPAMPALPVAVSLLGIWGILGVMLAVYLPVYQFAHWSWDHYRDAQTLLEETRDRRAELRQALGDLAAANLQLTRLNRLAQGLRQAAEDAGRAKEQFVANVSHELRTPLNMIIGFGEMIMQAPEAYGSRIPPALLADLDVILRNSQHLADLIDDVLDLSQIEAGRMALTKERVLLHEIVEAAATVVRPLFEGKGLGLEVEADPGLPPILCDRTRIREVLVNLLSNAGRFTERGGVRVRAWRNGSDALVSVADSGPGIAPEDAGKVFRPFQQLDGSLRRRYGGSGLGLSISRAFVELHGGQMWFESEKGQGTTFYFQLPIDPPLAAQDTVGRWFSPYLEYEERGRRTVTAPIVRPRFVVLEAHDALRRLLKRYLDDAEIAPATSVEGALQELARVPAQALLVNEASVPVALQRFLQSSALPYGTPAIICSVPGGSEAAGALGADDYLVKPVSRQALHSALARINPRGKTILVVDDDPEALQLFRRMLGAGPDGYHVLRASDGRQALEILRAERPAALLVDLVMPGVDGFQLLAAKNEDPELRDIPAVVISARDPAGQPIVTSAVALTRGGGLSIPQLLGCISAVTQILAPAGSGADPAQPAGRAG